MASGNTPQRHDDDDHLFHDANSNPIDTVIVPANDNPESSQHPTGGGVNTVVYETYLGYMFIHAESVIT
jgi:hypothetical protein